MSFGDEKQDLTDSEKRILKELAKEGPTWYYNLYKEKKIASNKTVLQGLHRLNSLGLIETKKEYPQESTSSNLMGRKKTYYGLTFHGVLYCLNVDMFPEDEAAEVRLRNFAELPLALDPDPVFSPTEVALDMFEKPIRDELERVMLNLRAHMKQEGETLNKSINKIRLIAEQHKTHIKLFSMVEEKNSGRIYAALRKVNPSPKYYDPEYACYVFQKEYGHCFNESFFAGLASKQGILTDMSQVLSDHYSLEVLKKVLFPYCARIHKKLQNLESRSDEGWLRTWKSLEDWFSQLAKADADQIRSILLSGPKMMKTFKASCV